MFFCGFCKILMRDKANPCLSIIIQPSNTKLVITKKFDISILSFEILYKWTSEWMQNLKIYVFLKILFQKLVFRELLISKCTQVKKSQTQKNELYQAPILYHLMKYVHTDTNQSNFLFISVYKSYSVSDFEK